MSREQWKQVVGYEGYYEVSNHGRVRSVTRLRSDGQRLNGRVLSPKIDRYGYAVVCLCVDNKRKYSTVHRLVAKAFIPNPNNLPHVDHKDWNRLNNYVDNLRWVTEAQNTAETYYKVHNVPCKGNKLEATDYIKVREMYATGLYSQAEVGRTFGINQSMVSKIILKQSWNY